MADRLRIFIFGLGYSALRFARIMAGEGAVITGTTRSAEKAAALAAEGFQPLVFNGELTPQISAALAGATHVVSSVAPGEDDPVLAVCGDALRAAPLLRWLGYLSTTGVYGSYGGAWVSEDTTPHPRAERSVRRLAAERLWRRLAVERGVPLSVFRIAGIYGPGRNPFVALAEGKANRIVKPGLVLNRIHVADIAAALSAAAVQEADGIFNLSDDEPTPPQDLITFAAELMGVEPPAEVPYDAAAMPPFARSFYEENKRVTNARLKALLGGALQYPDYRAGLKSLWREGNWREG